MNDEACAHSFANEVCRGNQEALVFCTLWYQFAHLCDDIVDSMEDGRPTMPPEKIIESYIILGMVYNCPFYKKHSDLLFSTVISITNTYADSVAWERSPVTHRRLIADVLRTCGNEMFFIVAMIIGGWSHVRSVSARIRETDWLRQHTKPDDFK